MNTETPNMTAQQVEAYEEILRAIEEQIDPRDYLAPSMREIAKLPLDQLEAENQLVVAKQSTRSRAQRDMIQSRWEYEQTKSNTADESN
jgi:hypothetical protein